MLSPKRKFHGQSPKDRAVVFAGLFDVIVISQARASSCSRAAKTIKPSSPGAREAPEALKP